MIFSYILNPKTKGGLGILGSDLEDTYIQLQVYPTKENENDNDIIEIVDNFTRFVVRPSFELEAFFNNKLFNAETLWLIHERTKFPVLPKLSCRIFAISTSSTSSERVWSIINLIHTKNAASL